MTRHPWLPRGDAGTVTILFATGITAIILILTLTLDFSGHLRTAARARALAEQAARAGAQVISIGSNLSGAGAAIDFSNQTVKDQVHDAACDPAVIGTATTCEVTGLTANSVTVQIGITYHTLLQTMLPNVHDFVQTVSATAVIVVPAVPATP